MEHSILLNVLIYLAAAVLMVPIFRRLGLGAILGYLAAGAVIGPQGLHFIVHPEHALHFAEFGVVLLLFVIGLELNPEKLWRMRLQITLLGGGQLVLSSLVIGIFVHTVIGLDATLSILIGLTLGLSSTAFAVQLMDEQGVMGAPLGRKGFSILLLQDIAVIPILLLVNFWAPENTSGETTDTMAWWVRPLAVVAVLTFGRFFVNPALRLIARYGSREVLTAASLLIVLGTAMVIQKVGLSMGMGAFLAGIILANSSFRHQLEADIEPFKGLLLGLFFIAVGMTLDLQLLVEKPLIVIGLALLLMLVKTLLVTGLVHLRACSWKEGIWLGLMLSQGGEFAFVVMAKSVGLSLVGQEVADYVVLVVGLSMALTSPAVMLFRAITDKPSTDAVHYDSSTDEEPEVVVAGFGRFGQIIGRILAANRIHFTALDKDASHVEFVKRFGNKIFFGDATRLDLLQAAGIDHARVLVVAVDTIEDSLAIVQAVKEAYPKMRIIARAHNRMHVYQLKGEKVQHIVRELVESSLSAARDTLVELGFTEGQAINKVDVFRKHDNALLDKAAAHKDDMNQLLKISNEGRQELEQLFEQDEKI